MPILVRNGACKESNLLSIFALAKVLTAGKRTGEWLIQEWSKEH